MRRESSKQLSGEALHVMYRKPLIFHDRPEQTRPNYSEHPAVFTVEIHIRLEKLRSEEIKLSHVSRARHLFGECDGIRE